MICICFDCYLVHTLNGFFFNMAFLIYLLNLPLLETLIFFNFLEAIKPSAVDIWERMVWCHLLIISFINSWALNF